MSTCEDTKPDYFGFTKEYDRKKDYPEKKPPPGSTKKLLIKIATIIFIIISILLMFLSGYIAWNSFTNDPVYLKAYKTLVAVLFYPIYLFYIFIKNVIFQLP
jgi:hypothetical protein